MEAEKCCTAKTQQSLHSPNKKGSFIVWQTLKCAMSLSLSFSIPAALLSSDLHLSPTPFVFFFSSPFFSLRLHLHIPTPFMYLSVTHCNGNVCSSLALCSS